MRRFEINDEGQFEFTKEDYAAMGKRIQAIRKARGLSQNELADMVSGCNRKRISSIENGSPTITAGELFCISMELQESFSTLLCGCGDNYLETLDCSEIKEDEWNRQYLIRDITKLLELLPHKQLIGIREEIDKLL